MTEPFLFRTLLLPLTGTVSDGYLTSLSPCPPDTVLPSSVCQPENKRVLALLETELAAYFAGQLQSFSIPARYHGTPYQQSVWAALRQIPYGQSRTYGEIAVQLGYTKPIAARAVGNACHNNPILILTPCHRVFAKNSLGGFAGAPHLKRWLCQLESIPIPETIQNL